MNRTRRVALALAACALGMGPMTAPTARASFMAAFDPAASSGTTFAYSLVFIPSTPGDGLSPGLSFVTLYDLPAGTTFSSASPQFSLTVSNFGVNPAGFSPTDTSLPNVTVTYNGTGLSNSSTFLDVLTATAPAGFTGRSVSGFYVCQSAVDDGRIFSTAGAIVVPAAVNEVTTSPAAEPIAVPAANPVGLIRGAPSPATHAG